MKNIKKSYFIIFGLIVLAVVCFSTSYAIFSNTKEEHGKLNIVAGNLNYKIESSELDSDSITIPVNTSKEIRIKLTSLNEVSSKYELYYILDKTNDKVSVGYSKDTKDSVLGTVEGSSSKMISIVVRNDSDTSSKVTFKVLGGLLNNNLALKDGNSLNQEVEPYRVLSKAILEDNKLITATPTLTTSSNNTNDASGLYSSTATNTGEPTYYFRGNVTNNYVKFAGFTWRIVRINEDGTVRLIMQDGINNNTNYQFNSNYNNYTYMYYTNSNAKTTLENWYQTNIGSKADLAKNVASGNYYCEQAKQKRADSYTSGSATMTTYNKYTPDFKCESDGNGKGIVNASVGLLNYDEVAYAGGYPYSNNNSYYLYNSAIDWWTMSPASFSGSYSCVWYISTSGSNYDHHIYDTYHLRAVLNLTANTQIIGNGTSSNPYKIS
jgi:hypothetical protein